MIPPVTSQPAATSPTPVRPPPPVLRWLAYAGYDVLGLIAAAAAVPALPWLLWRGYGTGAGERLGRLPAAVWQLAGPVWVHCASVGEVRSAAPLAERLRQRVPRPLLVSTTTTTGRTVAREALGADAAMLVPVDALRIVDRVFRRLRPRALIVLETEIWPGLLRAAAAVGAPAALVSGRLSPGAFQQYRRGAPLFAAALAHVAAFGMQTDEDAARIVALGAPPERVRVTGSLKAAIGAMPGPPPIAGLDARRVLVAASTQPGEEAFVLDAFALVRRAHPDAVLIIAPRRPERFDAVAELVAATGWVGARRSALAGTLPPATEVLVLDSLGELVRFYPAAWAVFVGGTVVPLGGHNVREPAAYGRAVAFGPHTEHVAEAATALERSGGGATVASPVALASWWDRLLADRALADAAGARARAAAADGGALDATWALLAPLLGVAA